MLMQSYSNNGLTPINDDAIESRATLAPGNYRAGQTLAQRAGESVKRVYDPDASDGSEVPLALLVFDTVVDSADNHFLGGQASSEHRTQGEPSAPVFITGTFRQSDLVGLDANCVGKLCRVTSGSIADGDAVIKLL